MLSDNATIWLPYWSVLASQPGYVLTCFCGRDRSVGHSVPDRTERIYLLHYFVVFILFYFEKLADSLHYTRLWLTMNARL